MNLANKFTVFRIILVPIMVIIPFLNIQGEFLGIPTTYWIINIIFIIGGITDKIDGYIARSRNQITTFGKFLDPIADKILVITAMIMLVEFKDAYGISKLPAWIPVIVIIREFIVSGYRLIAVEKGGKVIAASVWGKLKTVTQMIAVILAFIDLNSFAAFTRVNLTGFELVLNILSTSIMFICVIATIFSGWDYIRGGKDLLKDK